MTRKPTGPQVVVKPISEVMPESWCVAQMAEGRFMDVVPHLLVLQARAARAGDGEAIARLTEMLGVANWEVERHAQARVLFARVLHHAGNVAEKRYYRVRTLDAISAMRMKQYPVAAAILEEIGAELDFVEEPTLLLAQLAMAELALERREADRALDLVNEVARKSTASDVVHGRILARCLMLFAACHLAQHQPMKALDDYYRAISMGSRISHPFLVANLHFHAARLIGQLRQDPVFAGEILANERVRHPAWHLSQAQALFFEYGNLACVEDVAEHFRTLGRRQSDRIVEQHVLEPATRMARAFVQLSESQLQQLHADALGMADVAPDISAEIWTHADGLLLESVQRYQYVRMMLNQLERLQQDLVAAANLLGVERNRLLDVLAHSQKLASAQSEEELIPRLLGLVRDMLGADAVLYEAAGSSGEPPVMLGEVSPWWQAITKKVFATRHRVYGTLPDGKSAAEYAEAQVQLSEGESARVMAVPLGTGEIQGVVYAEKNGPSGIFSTVDLMMLEALCMQASLLISNFQAVRQLVLTQGRLDAALDAIGDGVVVVDAQGRVTLANRAALGFWGLGSAEGRKLSRLPGRWPAFGAEPVSMEAHLLQLPRAEVLLRSTPLLDDAQKCIGHVLTLSEMRSVRRSFERIAGSSARYTFEDLAGEHPAFLERVRLAKLAAMSDADVLILGESGTGKEVFAQAIHNQSSRRDKPFVGINCAAIPSELLESELFGYEEGAFTGAVRGGRPGKFELAEGGTILLDEIGDMPLEMQAKLLRVLEERRCRRVGGTEEYTIDVRVISTTNRPLDKLVAQNRFRGDLLYRLRVIQIRIPPLRERRSDILLLAQLFLERYAKQFGKAARAISPEVKRKLENYDWPGNVRELEHLMEASVHFLEDRARVLDRVEFTHESEGPESAADAGNARGSRVMALDDLKRESLIEALRATNGMATAAARMLGVSRATLYNMMDRFGIEPSAFRRRKS